MAGHRDDDNHEHRGHDAVGGWQLTVTVTDPPSDPPFTFKTNTLFTSDGLVQQATSVIASTALGIWIATGQDRLQATFYIFRFDSEGPAGSSRVRATYELVSKDRIRGKASVDQFDPDGRFIQTLLNTMEGTRMEIVP